MNYKKEYELASSILIENFYFYASMLSQCSLIWTKETKTAGVRIMYKGTVEFLINPEFFLNQTKIERAGLLLHEMLHILNGHIQKSNKLPDAKKKKANVSMDLENNQLIPDHWLPLGSLNYQEMGLPLPSNEIWEKYFNLLPDMDDDRLNDDHSIWMTGDATESKAQDILERMVEKAIERTKQKGVGSIPQKALDLMEERRKRNQISWDRIFHSFIGRKMTYKKTTTRKKPNKRLGLMAAGKTKAMGPKILFGTDVSASVSDEDFVVVMSEAISATKEFPDKVDMFFFDWEVFKDQIKIGSQKYIPRRPGKGGTSFEAAFKYASTKKPDLLIILTDGEDSPPETLPRCPVLWVIKGKDNPALPGMRVVLPDNVTERAQLLNK